MRRRLFVHIGAPKTGTSYLQSLLWAGKRDFRAAGVLIPGQGQKNHFAAGSDLAGDPGDDYIERVRREPHDGAWDRLARRILSRDAPAVVFTDERLARSQSDAPKRIAELGADFEIHVVYTIRALDLTLPSAWQTYVKHGATISLQDWLDTVLGGEKDVPAHDHFWRSHHVGQVMQRWRPAFVAPSRAHLITVPRTAADPAELWRRFAATVGLPPEPPTTAPRANTALDLAQVEALRRLNSRIGESMPPRVRRRVVRNLLATRLMGELARGRRASLPARFNTAAAARADEMAAAIASGGYSVVGDIADLRIDSSTPDQPAPTELEIATATEDALAALVQHLAQRS